MSGRGAGAGQRGTDPAHDGGEGLRDQALRGAAWSGLEKWGARVLSTLVFLVLARLLEPADFGLVALATVFVDIAEKIREQGLTLALVQRKDLRERHLHTAFWLSVIVGTALAVLLLVVAGPLAAVMGDPDLEPILRALSLVFVIGALGRVPDAVLLRGLRFRALAVRGLASNSIAGVVGIGLALGGAGAWALVAQIITQAIVITVVLLVAARYRPKAEFGGEELRELWSFGGKVLAYDLVNVGYRRGDDLIIGGVLGSVALGFYTIAYRLLMVLTDTLTRTVQQVVLPTFSKLQDDTDRMRSAFYSATRLQLAVSAPAFGGVAAVAPELVAVVFGERWLPAVPAMQLLCIVGALQGISWFANDVMVACGRPGLRLNLMIARTVVTVAAFAVGTAWGFVGVAAASAIASVVFVPVTFVVVRPLLSLRVGPYLRQVFPATLATAVMIVVVTLVRQTLDGRGELARLTVSIPVGAVAYGLAMAVVGRREIRELVGAGRTVLRR